MLTLTIKVKESTINKTIFLKVATIKVSQNSIKTITLQFTKMISHNDYCKEIVVNWRIIQNWCASKDTIILCINWISSKLWVIKLVIGEMSNSVIFFNIILKVSILFNNWDSINTQHPTKEIGSNNRSLITANIRILYFGAINCV